MAAFDRTPANAKSKYRRRTHFEYHMGYEYELQFRGAVFDSICGRIAFYWDQRKITIAIPRWICPSHSRIAQRYSYYRGGNDLPRWFWKFANDYWPTQLKCLEPCFHSRKTGRFVPGKRAEQWFGLRIQSCKTRMVHHWSFVIHGWFKCPWQHP